jgi:hypothetical protein
VVVTGVTIGGVGLKKKTDMEEKIVLCTFTQLKFFLDLFTDPLV